MNSHASHSERVYEAAQPETIIGVSQSVKAEMGCAPTPAPRVAKVPPFPAAVLVSRGTLARTQLAPAPASRAAGLLPTLHPYQCLRFGRLGLSQSRFLVSNQLGPCWFPLQYLVLR